MQQLLSLLRAIVGDAQLLTDADLKASYETDWTRRFSGSALAVVRPGSTDEVAAVVRCCADAGVAIVPQGGNTGLVGGSVPRGGEVVLSLGRLRWLEPVEGGAVSVGAGVTLAALQAHAAAAGWQFGVDLGARDSATIGGMIATNAGGINVLRHGTMRQQLLGVEAVLADGSTVSRLAGLRKDNTGYDLAGLLCGSEGTLGIVTRARLALVPPLPARAAALVALPSVEAVLADGSTVSRLAGLRKDNTGYDLAGLLCGSEGTLGIVTRARLALVPPLPARAAALVALPSVEAAISLVDAARRELPSLLAAELFFEEGLALVVAHTGAARPFTSDHGAYLLLEVAAQEDPSDELAAFLGDRDEVLLASDATGRRRLWELRERHTEAIASAGIVHKLDVSLPPARLAEFIGRIGPALASAVPGARLILYGHVAEANLHVNVLGPAADDQSADEAVLSLVVEMGGSISAEHGIGVAKAGWLERDREAADVAAMRAIKRALDRGNILNPGVLFAPSR